MTVIERAYAKLNLTLDMLGKRPDGYHEMDMVMQTVSAWDEVSITLTDKPGIEVDINRDDLPKNLDNLAGKAADKFFRAVNITDKGVEVYINKKLPDKAGLAGGSADAAAVIRGLAKLLPETRLSLAEMLDIAAKVGSDVPFCLVGGTKRARGRGELLSELPPMPDCQVVIVKPTFSVSTPELFRAVDLCEIAARPDADKMANALARGDLDGMCREVGNVFEQALPKDERAIVDEIKSALTAAGASAAAMTGSGSAVFGVFSAEKTINTDDYRKFGDVFLTKPVGNLV